MAREIFEVTKDRFHLQNPCCYILQGTWPKEARMRACLDGSEVKAEIKKLEMVSALERFKDPDLMRGERITAEIRLPESLEGFQKLSVYADMPDKNFCWFSVPVKELERRRGKPQFFIEEEKVQQGFLRVRGWAVASEPVKIQIFDENKEKISAEILRTERVDVEQLYEETEIHDKTGFFVELTNLTGKFVYIVFYAGNTKSVHIAHLQPTVVLRKKVEKYAKKGLRYWRSQGSVALVGKIAAKVKTASTREIPYQKWILRHLPSQKELEKQRREKFDFQPKISIVIPLYKTPEKYLRQLVDTVKAQTYPNWELCLSDGSGADSPIAGLLKELAASDERIKVVSHDQQLQISENTNAGIEIATGDYIAFADHDDELTPHALFECVKALNKDRRIRVLYSDEDKMSETVERIILSLSTESTCIQNHVLVLFESFNFSLTSVRAIIVDSHLNSVYEQSWNEYISINESSVVDKVDEPNSPANNPSKGLKLTAKATARKQSVALRKEDTKQNNIG